MPFALTNIEITNTDDTAGILAGDQCDDQSIIATLLDTDDNIFDGATISRDDNYTIGATFRTFNDPATFNPQSLQRCATASLIIATRGLPTIYLTFDNV